MATDTKKVDKEPTLAERQQAEAAHALDKTKRAQAQRETLTTIDSPAEKLEPKLTPEEAKKQAEATKAEHEAIDKVAKVNANLAKDGSANRADVTMKDGEPQYRFGNFVPTRILTEDELVAMEGVKV